MEIIFKIILFFLFLKLFLFWLWLWQIKEYHLKRFLAHFERQSIKKIIASFWRLKYPQFTLKIIIIFLSGTILTLFLLFRLPFFILLFFILFAPLIVSLIVFLFQIPTIIWRQTVISRACQKRKKFTNLLVVAIAGSYGKTSTKDLLADILSDKFGKDKVLKTEKNHNSEIGISRCILNKLDSSKKIFIVEMGAYVKGGIKLLCDIVQPKIGFVTGVNEQHLSTFGSMEKLLSAEGGEELIESLLKNQDKIYLNSRLIETMAFFNANNKYCRKLYKKTLEKKNKIKPFLYGEKAEFKGQENILGALAAAREMGATESEIENALKKLGNNFPGIRISKGKNNYILVNASYSANPHGLLAHLEYVNSQFPGVKKVIVMPCLIELGKASPLIHKKIGKEINRLFDLAIITTADYFKEIKEGAKEKAVFLDRPEEILKKINHFCRAEDVVVLESRVPEKVIKELL